MNPAIVTSVHCRRCGATFGLPLLTDTDRARVAQISRSGHHVEAIQLMRQQAGTGLRDAKAAEMHITRKTGICH